MTAGLYCLADQVFIDVNGDELFACAVDVGAEAEPVEIPESMDAEAGPVDIPESIGFDSKSKKWIVGVCHAERNLLFEPLGPSGRYGALRRE